ncbi:MAG: nucleotidyltransferase domain-containing protein [Nanoarchaeota archaeon]
MATPQERLLSPFFYQPMTRFGVRDLGRQSKLDTKTVMKYLDGFRREGLIIRHEPKGSYPYFEANRLSIRYRFEKSHALMRKIVASGLIEHLEKNLGPKAIVLFGSVKKGTYHEKSDIDMFIQAKQKRMDLSRFESKVGHKINLFFDENPKSLTPGLLQNIYNGEVLSGNLDLP